MTFIIGTEMRVFNVFLFLTSLVVAQETITADPCSVVQSVGSSCAAKFDFKESVSAGPVASVASPTHDDVDVLRCFCCLGEAPLTPAWSSCAAQLDTKSAMSSGKAVPIRMFHGCAGFEGCRVETATPAACGVMSSWVASCSESALPHGTTRIPANERYSRMEKCLCPGSAPYEFNDAFSLCQIWAALNKPEVFTSIGAFVPFSCYDVPGGTFSATPVSTASWTAEQTGTSSLDSNTAASSPASSAGSAIPTNTAVSQASSSSPQPNSTIIIIVAVVVVIFLLGGGIAVWSSVKGGRSESDRL